MGFFLRFVLFCYGRVRVNGRTVIYSGESVTKWKDIICDHVRLMERYILSSRLSVQASLQCLFQSCSFLSKFYSAMPHSNGD